MAQVTTREQALDLCRTLPNGALEAVAMIVETAGRQRRWVNGIAPCGNAIDYGGYWLDDVQATLNALAAEFKGLKRG